MKRKIVIGVTVLAVVAGGGWWGYKQFTKGSVPASAVAEGPEGAPIVRVQPVMRRPLVQEIFSPGRVDAGNLQEHKAPVDSPRVSVKVKMGQTVQAGDLLVELDATELLEKVKAQELQLLRAENSLAKMRRELANAPLRLSQQVEEAKRKLVEAENALATALREADSSDDRVAAAKAAVDRVLAQSQGAQQAVDEARSALTKAEAEYLANPGDQGLATAYRKAGEAYEQAVRKNQETARETAVQLAKAEADLAAVLQEASRKSDGESAAVRLARVQVELARAAVTEAEEAYRRGADTEEIRMAEAELEANRATYAKLQADMNETRITATAPGVVLGVGVKDGAPVQKGTILVRVGDMERMTIVGRAEAMDLDNLKPGQPIIVTSSLLPLARFEGKVLEVGQQTSQGGDPGGMMMRGGMGGESISFEVSGEVLNPEGKLKSGMKAEMRIETARKEDALVIPLLAIREDGGTQSVLVVNNYTVEVRQIQTGLVTSREVEVVDGLQEGDQVIVSPFGLIETLTDGAKVRIEGMPGGIEGPGGRGPGGRAPVGGRVEVIVP